MVKIHDFLRKYIFIILLCIELALLGSCVVKSVFHGEPCGNSRVFITFFLGILLIYIAIYRRIDTNEYLGCFIVFAFFVFTTWNLATSEYDFVGYYSAWDYGDLGVDTIRQYDNSLLTGTNYPPIAVLIYKFLARIQNNGITLPSNTNSYLVWCYLMLCVVIIGFSVQKIVKDRLQSLHPEIHFFALLFSGPFIYTVGRGNVSLLALALVFLFVAYYENENRVCRVVAYFALALAACLKLYPAVFGIVLLKKEKIKGALTCGLMGLTLFALPFVACAIENSSGVLNEVFRFIQSNSQWTNNSGELSEHSLSLFTKIGFLIPNSQSISYFLVAFILLISFLLSLRADDEQKCVFAAFWCVAVPSISLWYSVSFFLVPFIMHVCKYKRTSNAVLWYIKLFAYLALLIYLYGGRGLWNWFPYKGYWRIMVLVILNSFEIFYGFFSQKKEDIRTIDFL